MWSDILSALTSADFKQLNELIGAIDVLEVLKNPYVIGLIVVASILFVIRGMEKALVTFLSIPAFLVLFQHTIQGKNALDFNAEKLLIFIGGFMALGAVNVYFHMVRK